MKLLSTTDSNWNKHRIKSKSGGRSGRRSGQEVRQKGGDADVADAGEA